MELKECARVWGGGEAMSSAQEFRVHVPRASSPWLQREPLSKSETEFK